MCESVYVCACVCRLERGMCVSVCMCGKEAGNGVEVDSSMGVFVYAFEEKEY